MEDSELIFKPFPKMDRLSKDALCVITEKLDGTNAQIVITSDGKFLTGSRNRWITPEDDNYGFSRWAHENKDDLMQLGEGQHFGEWWGSGIQRRYNIEEKRFSLFNVSRWDNQTKPECCHLVPVLANTKFELNAIEDVMVDLKQSGSIAAKGFMNPEGVIIYHTGTRKCYKKTFEHDKGKWSA